jgi:hypothetical protein
MKDLAVWTRRTTSKNFPLAKTHFTINKFGRPTEEGFLMVGDVIEEMVAHAHNRRPLGLSARTDDVKRSTTVSNFDTLGNDN